MAKYLVTGGAGFIGSNITEELVRRKEDVRVLDSLITGNLDNIKPFRKGVDFVKGDIRDRKVLKRALKGIDYVIHQAALRSVPKSVDDPFTTNDINVFGTLNVLFEAKAAGVKRVVYASSSAAYGDARHFPQKETDLPAPISPYGVSKLAAEHYCVTFAKTFGLETVSLRYFNVFGPRQNPESKYSAVVPIFISNILNRKPPVVEWDGRQSRDFVYVGDVVAANLNACHIRGISGEVFNIGSGRATSVMDILNGVNRILGGSIKPIFEPKRSGDVRKTYADIGRMKRLLKMKKLIKFEDGLRRTIDWFKNK